MPYWLRAWQEPTPSHLQQSVRAGIFALVWIDVSLAISGAGLWALAVAACWIPARIAGKWLYST
jgi:hypothetical protein